MFLKIKVHDVFLDVEIYEEKRIETLIKEILAVSNTEVVLPILFVKCLVSKQIVSVFQTIKQANIPNGDVIEL